MSGAGFGRHMAYTPMLDGSAELIVGYRAFHEQEGKYTAIALAAMPDAIAIWYRYLTLFDKMLRREHSTPFEEHDDRHRAWHLRLQLSSAAAGTVKLVLDAALAGYYSPAFGLIRHLYETWQQMVYVRFNPATALQWYSPDGRQPPREPSAGTIANGLKRFGRNDAALQRHAAVVERQIKSLNKGAHPSGLVVAQGATGKPGYSQLGANYVRSLLAQVMSAGTQAVALLLDETALAVPVDDAWRTEFTAILHARSDWYAAEFGATSTSIA